MSVKHTGNDNNQIALCNGDFVAVTVIIPFYNSEATLYRCLSSLNEQEMDNSEFICIDDGSEDNSASICAEYCKSDSRFKMIKRDHQGVSSARNCGLQEKKGKYVLFMDSDDVLMSNSLDLLYRCAELQNVDDIKFNAKVVNKAFWMRQCFKRHNELITRFSVEDIFKNTDCRPFVWMHFIRSSIIDENRIYFNPELFIGEDQEFIIRMLQKCERVLFLNRKLYIYFNRKDSSYNSKQIRRRVKIEQHFIMVEAVLSTTNLDTDGLKEWVFDTLYYPFIQSEMNSSDYQQLVDYFEKYQILDGIDGLRLKKYEKLKKRKQSNA